jgi:hypothetical protein
MRWSWWVSLGLAGALVLPSVADAQQVRAGAEFKANTYSTNLQRFPDATIQANGNFVVIWNGVGAQDLSAYGVFGQRYDVTGAALGTEFLVNTYTSGFQFKPQVASDRRGNFVVVWSSGCGSPGCTGGQDGDTYGVFAQRYDANGVKRGGEFQVNSYTTGGQGSAFYFAYQNHSVSSAPNGNFVVVWGSYYNNQDGDGGLGSVQGQRYDGNGVRVGGEFRVNTYTTGYQWGPSVAVRDDNSFVVVWSTLDGSGYGIGGQRFDSGGNKVGAEFRVNTATAGDQLAPLVKMRANGDFTAVWTDRQNLGDVFARRYDASGNPLGAPFQVNSYTTGVQYTYSFGMDRAGNFIVNWNGRPDGDITGIGGRRFRADGTPREAEYTVNTYTSGDQFDVAVASDDVGNVLSAWTDSNRDSGTFGIFAQRFGGLRPTALSVDAPGNLVWEPGETVEMRPSWRNVNGAAQTFGSTLTSLIGPAGATYTINDGTASYGTVPNGQTAQCTDCFSVAVTNPTPRPILHWDASGTETITPDTQGQAKLWALHIGNSFADVPTSNPFYRFIETLLHNQITGGCTATDYCPASSTTREQMSVFVLVAKEGPGYQPVACGVPVFTDVPASSGFCRFIEELFRRGVVTGCQTSPPQYCPTAPVTREQMAVFVLRTLDPTLNPPNCTTPVFNDVPASSPFCKWIEELARRGVVTGCGGGNYCPTDPVTREQMGVFISVTFGLTLYGG